MHNSQNGGQVARGGSGVGWNSSGQLAGGSLQGPQNQLLVTTCVGCHSSTTSETIISFGGCRIPIVYNTVEPANPLAGGNFHWVGDAGYGDAYGHNVYGIADRDDNLNTAPGRNTAAICMNSCHDTLAEPPNLNNANLGGCRGCHVFTSHHNDSKPWYRFLKGHGMWTGSTPSEGYADYVTGIEDPNWEQDPAAGHNMYKGFDGPVVDYSVLLWDTHSMSSFCGGCHLLFHRGSYIGFSSPWLRHPTDIHLPMTGEYSGYDPVNNYSVEAPVAWTDPTKPTRATAVVMCLSCHRPHGSPYPDMLRWDYTTIVVGGGGSGGCFTCHTTKN